MHLVDFIEQFTPDYESRFAEFKKERKDFNDLLISVEPNAKTLNGTELSWLFLQNNFNDIIQNFSDQLCEMQRVNCKISWHNSIIPTNFNENTMWAILKSEQPKFDELNSELLKTESAEGEKPTMIACVAVSENCKNLEESYGEICVRCKKCNE